MKSVLPVCEASSLKAGWVNPYKARLKEFADTIFSLDTKASCEQVIKFIEQSNRPLLVEIGSGSGNHLVGLGQKYPNHLLVGIEIRFKRAVRTIEKAKKAELNNVIVLRGKVQEIAPYFESAKFNIEGCYVNFPDPWPKRRNKKHRVLTNGLMTSVYKWLVEDGFLSVKTDQHNYFHEFCAEIEKIKGFELEYKTEDLVNSLYAEDNILTEFEQLFISKGDAICHALFRRKMA